MYLPPKVPYQYYPSILCPILLLPDVPIPPPTCHSLPFDLTANCHPVLNLPRNPLFISHPNIRFHPRPTPHPHGGGGGDFVSNMPGHDCVC